MIEQYIIKKLAYIQISQHTKDACLQHLDSIANRYKNKPLKCTKKELTIQCCFKFIKIAQNLLEQQRRVDRLALLQFTKALLVQIYDSDKIQINLINIRIYLVLLKQQQRQGPNINLIPKVQQTKENKLMNKILLFLTQLRKKECFPFIIKDFYSHIERLYIQAIKFTIQSKKIKQCQQFIILCFQALQSHIEILSSQINIQIISFTPQENKILRILQTKIQLLHALYKLQYAIFIQQSQNHENIVEIIVKKYQTLISKVPNKYHAAQELEGINNSLKKQHGQHRIRQQFKKKTVPVYPNINKINQDNNNKVDFKAMKRQQIRAPVDFIKQFMDKQNYFDFSKYKIRSSLSLPNEQIFKRHNNRTKTFSFFSKVHNNLKNIQQNPLLSKKDIENDVNQKQATQKINGQSKYQKRSKAFSLIDRMQKMKKQQLKTINPFCNIHQKSKKLTLSVSKKQMINNGVFFHLTKPLNQPIINNDKLLTDI